jgi:hypothetical protein
MKRTFDEISKEFQAASNLCDALYREKYNHPEEVERRLKKRKEDDQQKLMDALPSTLYHHLVEVEKLIDITIDFEAILDDFNSAKDDIWACEVDTGSDYYPNAGRFESFEHVDFRANSRKLWRDACQSNDDELGPSLAAFCYACCEHLRDFEAYPSKAFPLPRGKNEEEK